MSEPTIREPDQIRQDCARKLRVVQVSDHFQAILGCLLGEDWTTPRLVEMVITPDGHLLGRCDGEATFKAFLGRIGRPHQEHPRRCPGRRTRWRRDRLFGGEGGRDQEAAVRSESEAPGYRLWMCLNHRASDWRSSIL